MKCDVCGKDVGTDGVVTVILSRKVDGSITSYNWRRCRPCTISEPEPVTAKEETEQ